MNLAGWTAVAYWSGVIIALGGMMASPFFPQRHQQRRVYWGCWLVGGSVLTLVGEHAAPGQGWLFAVIMAVSSLMIDRHVDPGGDRNRILSNARHS